MKIAPSQSFSSSVDPFVYLDSRSSTPENPDTDHLEYSPTTILAPQPRLEDCLSDNLVVKSIKDPGVDQLISFHHETESRSTQSGKALTFPSKKPISIQPSRLKSTLLDLPGHRPDSPNSQHLHLPDKLQGFTVDVTPVSLSSDQFHQESTLKDGCCNSPEDSNSCILFSTIVNMPLGFRANPFHSSHDSIFDSLTSGVHDQRLLNNLLTEWADLDRITRDHYLSTSGLYGRAGHSRASNVRGRFGRVDDDYVQRYVIDECCVLLP